MADRSRLDTLLEQLVQNTAALQNATRSYQSVKAIVAQLDHNPDTPVDGLGLSLHFGDATIPVMMPTDPEQKLVVLEDAMTTLGQEVIRLWGTIMPIAQQAKEHCDQAAAAAAAAAQAPPGGGT